ncbi:unnamed protein product, partial [Medioppia subpectinata]
ESILIHSAAGDVGQAAINVCKHYECDIYATVGTEEKKKFLMNEYNIPENKIFNSRDILFKIQIMDATDGDKLRAGFDCLAISGRFVEIGKYDMIQNKQLGMYGFFGDIEFIGVAVDVVMVNDHDYLQEFYGWLHKNSMNGCVKPLDYKCFVAKDVEKALQYMTTGKHIGKIVIKMRNEEMERKSVMKIKSVPNRLVTVKTYFNPNKVYIITGGLGGFGLELIPWMQYFGARKFVVTSRSGLQTKYQKYAYNRLNNMSKEYKFFEIQWIVSIANGLTIEGTKQLLHEARELGPIGGFCSSIDTKHKIFANLDQLSRQLDYSLDYFVLVVKETPGNRTMRSGTPCVSEYVKRDVGMVCTDSPYNSDPSVMWEYLKALKVEANEELSKNRGKSIVNLLWRSLGVDSNNTPNDLTLGEIGIESLMLKDYDAGNMVDIKKHIDHIKKATDCFVKNKFLIPSETYVRLNHVCYGVPVYFMPPLLVSFGDMEELANKINRPVIGINWTRELNEMTTFKDINQYYVNIMKTLEPSGRYDIVGYFDNSIACVKLVLNGVVGKAIIVDVIDSKHSEFLSDTTIMNFILDYIAKDLPESYHGKLIRELKKESDVKAKVRYIVNEMIEFAGKGLVATDMDEILHKMFDRIRMFSTYLSSKKKVYDNRLKLRVGKKWSEISGKVVIIKPFVFESVKDAEEFAEMSREKYFLPNRNFVI